ncbi:methyltransferase domain-containing protein, partial [Thiohalospira sp.]|uniref:methyltransferase domain-containing protein n=1 Tax=Thiohalospira sp. TaxID=3080549 RepID=UPI0039800D60
ARRRLGGWRAPWRGRRGFAAADLEALPFPAASFDLVFSNLTLQWCDPAAAFAEVRRVLRPGGLFLFTTFGPDTLHELRSAWAAVDGEAHVNTFVDMHDLGDELVHAGLADPVMDMEYFTLTYPDCRALMRDLKAIGAQTVTGGRRSGLTGRRALAALEAAYEAFRTAEGVLPTTWEVVHGHAWAPETTPAQQRAEDGATTVSLDSLRSSVRRS